VELEGNIGMSFVTCTRYNRFMGKFVTYMCTIVDKHVETST